MQGNQHLADAGVAELIDHRDDVGQGLEVGLIDLGRNVGHGANDLIQQRINVGHVLADGGVHVATQGQLRQGGALDIDLTPESRTD